ncbi:MAG: hypothetical protein Q8R00_05175 [Candidatus Nanoarchaeia archaeon]|nr:hypothetical protein [Candidatus Nanoarchaeia archaeon]
MANEDKRIGHFVWVMRTMERKGGLKYLEFDWEEDNIQREVIITRLRSFIRKIEDDFHDNFKGGMMEVKRNN